MIQGTPMEIENLAKWGVKYNKNRNKRKRNEGKNGIESDCMSVEYRVDRIKE